MTARIANLIICGAAALLATACGVPEADSPSSRGAGAGTTTAESRGAVASNPLREAYFGDTHVHTAYSLDAYIGGTRLQPSDAYRYARGEAIEVNGEVVQRRRPLDFVAVTDHAEYIGEMYSTQIDGAPGHDQRDRYHVSQTSDLEGGGMRWSRQTGIPERMGTL